ncbi:DUF3310 domain-containing protein [Brucella intermedia]|uniref:DUF3310 domain-containing protein n=1 Tax=Brucella intermedia TaxID=94625 RepID=UPI00224A4F87|nr:DUF3310 domain-containing protein [Brucella intermedia]
MQPYDRKQLLVDIFLHVNRDFNTFQQDTLRLVLGGVNSVSKTEAINAVSQGMSELGRQITLLEAGAWEPQRDKGDVVNKPAHYDRLPMEPTYFIVTSGGYHWCIENFIKYLCRYRWKNGVEDLRKALRNLAMFLRDLEGDKGWSR